MQLNYYDHAWPLNIPQCPCDVHFLAYLRKHNLTEKVIFHFGTGAHHIVGKTNFASGEPNEILAVTASPREYEKYIEFIIHNPAAARCYKVMFTDIYTLTPRIIPNFDLVTLFHLGEYYDEERSAYAQLDDASLLDLFLSKLNAGGRIFLYTRSGGYAKRRNLIDALTVQGRMVLEDRYETLLVYGRPR